MTAKASGGTVRPEEHTFAVLAYGESPYLEACLRSLTEQRSRGAVLLTTSTPSTFLNDMAARFGFPLLVNGRREGIAADWSFAYRSAATKYVTLAHQDDLYAPDYAQQCLAAAARHPDALLVFTDSGELVDRQVRQHSRTLSVKGCILRTLFAGREAMRSPWQRSRLLAFGNPISCPTVLYHRERIGPFSFDGGLSYNLDWDAWHRLAARKGTFVYVRHPLVSHRIHGGSALVRGTMDESRNAEDQMLFRRFWPRPAADLLARIYTLSYGTSWKG